MRLRDYGEEYTYGPDFYIVDAAFKDSSEITEKVSVGLNKPDFTNGCLKYYRGKEHRASIWMNTTDTGIYFKGVWYHSDKRGCFYFYTGRCLRKNEQKILQKVVEIFFEVQEECR